MVVKVRYVRSAPVTNTLAQVREKSSIFPHTHVMFAPVTNALDTLLTYVAVQGYLALHRYIHWVWRRKLDWKYFQDPGKAWKFFQKLGKISKILVNFHRKAWKFSQAFGNFSKKSTKNTNLVILGIFPGNFFLPRLNKSIEFFTGLLYWEHWAHRFLSVIAR